MERRDFLRLLGAAAGASVLTALGCARRGAPAAGAAAKAGAKAAGTKPAGMVGSYRHNPHPVEGLDAVLAKGTDPAAMLKAGLEPYGGMEAFVHSGDRVVIKPNLAWARAPGEAADVQPTVLAAVLAAVKAAGARSVMCVEHPCDSPIAAFDVSGADKVCKEANVRLLALDNQHLYSQVPIAEGVNMHKVQASQDLLDADAYIDLACCKTHSATIVTLGLKNQLGAIWRPQDFHEAASQNQGGPNLHQNIADLSTALRPTLTIIDCTYALLTNGPKGPGKVSKPGALVMTPDTVAADAVSCRYLNVKPESVAHIVLAAKAGVGRYQNLAVKEVQA